MRRTRSIFASPFGMRRTRAVFVSPFGWTLLAIITFWIAIGFVFACTLGWIK